MDNCKFIKLKKKLYKRGSSFYLNIPKLLLEMGFVNPSEVEVFVKFKPEQVKFLYWDKELDFDLVDLEREREAGSNPIPHKFYNEVHINT